MEGLKKVLATLILYQYNIRILHWNTAGRTFDPVHELVDEYVSKFNEFIDEVAEMIIMLGGRPISLPQVLQSVATGREESKIVLSAETYYYLEDIYRKIDSMFSQLMIDYQTLVSDNSIPSPIISKLEEHYYWLLKEGNYKNKQRLK
jgi:DNA-binding ferritin-like protein